MPDKNYQQRPVKYQSAQPEKPVTSEDKFPGSFKLSLFISEERAEKQDLKGHPDDYPEGIMRTLKIVGLEPGKSLLLSADRGNVKGDR